MVEICHDLPLKAVNAHGDVITYSVNIVVARAKILTTVRQAKRANFLYIETGAGGNFM